MLNFVKFLFFRIPRARSRRREEADNLRKTNRHFTSAAAILIVSAFVADAHSAALPPLSRQNTSPPAKVDFTRDIRPILSDNCYQCHGPDEKARKAKLRLDNKDGAFRVKDGKRIIIPGRSAQSELIRRVTNTDLEELMPPPKSNRKLTPAQIDLLRRWVDQGARWEVHWAFVPPIRPELPKLKNVRWPRNAVDRFVLARLEKEKLNPAP